MTVATKTVMTIEEELQKATGGKVAANPKNPARYRGNLVRAVSTLGDPEWKKLSSEARDWVNASVDAMEKKEEVPDFPDSTGEFVSEPETEAPERRKAPAPAKATKAEEVEEEEEALKNEEEESEPEAEAKPARKVGRPKAEKAASPAPTERKGRKPGGTAYFRKLMIENPDLSKESLLERTHEAGFPLSEQTVYVTYYETKNTLKVLRELGRLKE